MSDKQHRKCFSTENYKCPFGDPLQKDDSIHNCVLYRSLSAGPDRFDDTCPTGSYCQPFDDNLVGYTEGFCCPTPEVQCPIGSDQYKCDGETNCTCDPITNYFYGVEIINSVSRLCCAEPCPFGASSHDGICKFDTAGKSGQLSKLPSTLNWVINLLKSLCSAATFGVKCSGDTQCKPAYSQCAKGLCNCKKSFAQKQQKCLPKGMFFYQKLMPINESIQFSR